MGNLHIQNETFGNETIKRLMDVEFWVPLMTELLPIFTEVEVRCWKNETEMILIIKPFAHTIRIETDLVIFTMPLNQKLKDLFLQSANTVTNKIIWFSLHFKKNGYHICSVEHHGAEIQFNQITNAEAIHIQSFFPKETVFHYSE
jgi:hypothetical protein